jgi:hypothetical protein
MGRPKGSKNKGSKKLDKPIEKVDKPLVIREKEEKDIPSPSINKMQKHTPTDAEYRDFILQYHADLEVQVKRLADNLDKIIAWMNKLVKEKE